jgi:hypothetical protein
MAGHPLLKKEILARGPVYSGLEQRRSGSKFLIGECISLSNTKKQLHDFWT